MAVHQYTAFFLRRFGWIRRNDSPGEHQLISFTFQVVPAGVSLTGGGGVPKDSSTHALLSYGNKPGGCRLIRPCSSGCFRPMAGKDGDAPDSSVPCSWMVSKEQPDCYRRSRADTEAGRKQAASTLRSSLLPA